jgi:hypothetical protein
MVDPDGIEAIRQRQRTIRRTAEALVSVAEQSGCSVTDLLVEVALLAAFQQNLARGDAIDVVNRAHNRVVLFMQLMNWDNFVESIRAEIEAAQETEGKTFRGVGATV